MEEIEKELEALRAATAEAARLTAAGRARLAGLGEHQVAAKVTSMDGAAQASLTRSSDLQIPSRAFEDRTAASGAPLQSSSRARLIKAQRQAHAQHESSSHLRVEPFHEPSPRSSETTKFHRAQSAARKDAERSARSELKRPSVDRKAHLILTLDPSL